LGLVFAAPLLQTPILHSTVTMAKDGLLPDLFARDSRVPLAATQFALGVLLSTRFDLEGLAAIASVGAISQVTFVAYCCLSIRLGPPTKLVSVAEYEQNSRDANELRTRRTLGDTAESELFIIRIFFLTFFYILIESMFVI
jgi:hypothetical protein